MGSVADLRPDASGPNLCRQGVRSTLLGSERRRRSSTGRPNRPTRRARPTRSSPRWRGWKTASSPANTVVDDNGYIELGTAEIRKLRRRGQRPDHPRPRARSVLRRLLLQAGLARCGTTNDLQEWSTKLGIGRPTGIDLPTRRSRPKAWCRARSGATNCSTNGNEPIGPGRPGDNVQLAVGQGDLQTDPLEMAIAYAALGNGGTVVTPHLGMEVMDAAGRVLQEIDPGPRRHVDDQPESRAADHGRAARRDLGPGRHGDPGLRRIPDPDRGQDRHRGTRRPRATSPGSSRWRRIRTRTSSPW